jgi:fatty acid desaturase
VYGCDLLASTGLAWAALLIGLAVPVSVPVTIVMATVAMLAAYRALSFVHELHHLPRGAVPGVRYAYDLLVGGPLLVPSVSYVGMHGDHHHARTYGTAADPEYLPLASHPGLLWSMVLWHWLAFPLFLGLRFLVVGPVALVVPALHRWLAERASSLALNPCYRRPLDDRLLRELRWSQILILAWWAPLLAWCDPWWLPLAVWGAIACGVAILNNIRAAVAHRYASSGAPQPFLTQIADALDHPHGWWAELWAPVGLRYHALHHLHPGVPYHHLPALHARLLAELPAHHPLHRAQAAGLATSLRAIAGAAWAAHLRPIPVEVPP